MGYNKRSRAALYFVLFAFSIVTLVLSGARKDRLSRNTINILTFMPRENPWDWHSAPIERLQGLPLGHIVRYEKILTEIIISSVFTMLWALYSVITLLSRRRWDLYVPTIRAELVALFAVWILMLFGAVMASAEHDLWYDYTSYMNIYQRLNYPNAYECWFSGECDDLRAMIAFTWLTWIVLSLLIILAIAGPASAGALVHFGTSMEGPAPEKKSVVFYEEAFEYNTANLIGRESHSSEYMSAPENTAGENVSGENVVDENAVDEKSRLVDDMD